MNVWLAKVNILKRNKNEKITLFKVWTIKNEDGSSISYQDSEKFQNKTFEVIEYIYEYKDILKIKNEDGVFFSIDIENAILKGEIKTGFSENEILDILKKEREKLELGIISEEEFEKRKKELLKQMN